MSKFDVLARIKKTGEERIYPENVFANISDDTENPLDFIKYVDIPQDSMPPQASAQPEQQHSQILVDELLRLREENNMLKLAASEEPEKKSVGRPKKETA